MKWISVKDRLPNRKDRLSEENKTFLTYDGNYIRTAEILYIKDGILHWLDGGIDFSGVTHWMPLPKPPDKHNELRKKLNYLHDMERKEASQFVTEVLKYLMDSMNLEKNDNAPSK